jgi:hypothetical protein
MKDRPLRLGMDALKSIPRAGWVCALVALLVTVAWSLIIPLFQVPDEPAHLAYAQYLAETGKPPSGSDARQPLSQQERLLLDAVHWKAVTHRLQNQPPAGFGTQQRLEWLAEHPGEPLGGGGYTSATNNPPLYYAAEAAVYHLTPSSSLANRIHVMRLLSALLAAMTVLFIFLFLRDLMPGTPWAWTVGALVVAFQPMFGFISGGVSSDNLLYTATAGLFWTLASSFRRGLTVPGGVLIGVFAAVGTLAKINMIGLLPGAAIGLALLVRSSQPAARRESMRGAIYAAGIVAGAALIYVTLNQVAWDRGVFLGSGVGHPLTSGPARGTGNLIEAPAHSVVGAFNYAWQFYLPRLPFMPDLFLNYPLNRVWLDGFVGNFGWLDYQLPGYVYEVAKVIAVVVVILAARMLFMHRALLRDRAAELITYVAMTVGLLILVNGNGFAVRADGGSGFEQARYLFPLLALYAAIVALAARGVGRRWGPAIGVLFVALAIAHTALAVLVTLTRYYG